MERSVCLDKNLLIDQYYSIDLLFQTSFEDMANVSMFFFKVYNDVFIQKASGKVKKVLTDGYTFDRCHFESATEIIELFLVGSFGMSNSFLFRPYRYFQITMLEEEKQKVAVPREKEKARTGRLKHSLAVVLREKREKIRVKLSLWFICRASWNLT